MRRLGLGLLLAAAVALGSCSDPVSVTELNPEGPPMVRQVFMLEKVDIGGGAIRVRNGLAFGTHPDLDSVLPNDDGVVTSAVALGSQRIRVVLDEHVRGNAIEEIACADGSYSRIPIGADPDDIAACSGPPDQVLVTCTGDRTVCICEDPDAPCAQAGGVGLGRPIGILDENDDGAADDFRMIDYGTDEYAVQVICDGVNIPLDRNQSFYNPSGNQLIPAGPIGINGLGPAVVLVPREGMRTGASCAVAFRPEVVDRDGNQVCAPPGGDISIGCNPGDTSEIAWGVEPLTRTGNDPADNQSNVPLGGAMATILIQFNANIDVAAAIAGISLSDGTAEVGVEVTVSANDRTIVTVGVPGGYQSDTEYTVSLSTDLADIFGGALPEADSFSFTTGMAPPDAAPEPDADEPDGGNGGT
jgi:hypothetical protein